MITARALGLDLRRIRAAFSAIPRFRRHYREFARAAGTSAKDWPVSPSFPCLLDAHDGSGTASGAYFHQDLLVARRIFERGPVNHVDVGSRIDGFVAHVAVFRSITVLDIRPAPAAAVKNIRFIQHDLMSGDPLKLERCDSLSCLHALEHFGLGRYGDPIDPRGHEKGLAAMAAIVEPGGILYLSVPIGRQRVEFNAHRIFAPQTVIRLANPWFDMEALSIVDDRGNLNEMMPLTEESLRFGEQLNYGCGVFEFRRRADQSADPR